MQNSYFGPLYQRWRILLIGHDLSIVLTLLILDQWRFSIGWTFEIVSL